MRQHSGSLQRLLVRNGWGGSPQTRTGIRQGYGCCQARVIPIGDAMRALLVGTYPKYATYPQVEVWRGRPGTPRSACRCSLYAGQWGSHGGGLLLVHGVMAGAFRRGWEIETYSGEPYGARPGVRDRGAEPSVPDRGRGGTPPPFTDAEIEKWRNEWSWDGSNRAGKLLRLNVSARNRLGSGGLSCRMATAALGLAGLT